MNIRKDASIVDQLFNNIDDNKYSIARFKLCEAIEHSQEARPEDAVIAREATPDREGQV